jgi:hypothetical protein
MEEFSELEKKVYDALIDNKPNEVSQRVRSIEELLSRTGTHTIEFLSSSEILDKFQKMEQQKIIKLDRSNGMNKKNNLHIRGSSSNLFGNISCCG